MAEIVNIINHIGLVLDASLSMQPHARSLVTVADEQVKHLAHRSTEMDQETRISIWTFNYANNIKCLVWDKDVLRLPSIASFYHPSGQTAFIDATLRSLDDLSETPERYGDHSFLIYVLTDGAENNSRNPASTLASRLSKIPDHWTVAALVPNNTAKHEAKRFGFPAGNVEVWDTSSKTGVSEVGERIRTATDAYMTSRKSGVRSTKNLFSTDATAVNATTIRQAGLQALSRDRYYLVHVPVDMDIKTFTEKECGHPYKLGSGFYELTKTETIQPQKMIAIVERGPRGDVYLGNDARQMIGLPDMAVRVKPDYNSDYSVFVQSTSINRKLIAHTKYLYLL